MQGIYWLLTIPHAHFTPFLPESVQYIKGQLEQGGTTDYLHWQLLVAFKSKCRLRHVKDTFGDEAHAELSRSSAANDYVWKDETSVHNTRFEIGTLKLKRNSQTDWDSVKSDAQRGRLDSIPSDIFVRYYSSLRRIGADYMQPIAIERTVFCYWGATGTGKSRRAWEEAGIDAYPKDPRSKFWDGYRSQPNVVFDEFRGGIDIAHLLRWFDRYPVIVEIKGSSVPLSATRIWITSNLPPHEWYPELDAETLAALMRRLTIVYFPENPLLPNPN